MNNSMLSVLFLFLLLAIILYVFFSTSWRTPENTAQFPVQQFTPGTRDTSVRIQPTSGKIPVHLPGMHTETKQEIVFADSSGISGIITSTPGNDTLLLQYSFPARETEILIRDTVTIFNIPEPVTESSPFESPWFTAVTGIIVGLLIGLFFLSQ